MNIQVFRNLFFYFLYFLIWKLEQYFGVGQKNLQHLSCCFASIVFELLKPILFLFHQMLWRVFVDLQTSLQSGLNLQDGVQLMVQPIANLIPIGQGQLISGQDERGTHDWLAQ